MTPSSERSVASMIRRMLIPFARRANWSRFGACPAPPASGSLVVAMAAQSLHRGCAGAGPLWRGPAGRAPGGDAVGVRAPVPADRRAVPTDRRAGVGRLGPVGGVVLPCLAAAV